MENIVKKQRILDRLKSAPLSGLKGTEKLLEKLKSQRCAKKLSEVDVIIEKQQILVRQLNQENLRLMKDNQDLKQKLDICDWDLLCLAQGNSELHQRNESLKEQLRVSQNICSRNLRELHENRKFC